MLGSYAIVGSHLPIVVGAAWSARPSGSPPPHQRRRDHRAAFRGIAHTPAWWRPVLFCENNLYVTPLPLAQRGASNPVGCGPARTVALASMVPLASKAAELLSAEGIEAEVVDLRGLVPLDRKSVV
jgi:hypothetical protein